MYEIKKINPSINVLGVESSNYAIKNTIKPIRKYIKKVNNLCDINLKKSKFDCVIALGAVYIHTLNDAIKLLKKIQKFSGGKSFITLASYTNEKDYWLFKEWTVLGTLLFKKKDWKKIMKYSKYTGFFSFVNSQTLSLKRK